MECPGRRDTLGIIPGPNERDDIAFLDAVIDTVAKQVGTPAKAALVGMSGGARMSSAYAAAHPERVVALAAVAGLRSSGLRTLAANSAPVGECRPTVPVIAFHGDADETNPYRGGDSTRWRQSVPDALAAWAAYNNATGPQESRVADRVDKIGYGDRLTNETTLYRVAGGSHSWPGGPEEGAFPGLDASRLIADFFAARACTL